MVQIIPFLILDEKTESVKLLFAKVTSCYHLFTT